MDSIIKPIVILFITVSLCNAATSRAHRSKFTVAKSNVEKVSVGPPKCDPGYFINDVSTCEICPDGTFASEAAANGCSKCVPGTYSLKGATICTTCPISTYSSSAGSSSCASTCPGGLVGSKEGATGSDACKSCKDGQYAKAGDTVCKSCDAGYYSLSGFSECKQCKIGFYSEKESNKCSVCPSGKYSLTDGSTGCDKCESSLSAQTDAGSSSACNFRESLPLFF